MTAARSHYKPVKEVKEVEEVQASSFRESTLTILRDDFNLGDWLLNEDEVDEVLEKPVTFHGRPPKIVIGEVTEKAVVRVLSNLSDVQELTLTSELSDDADSENDFKDASEKKPFFTELLPRLANIFKRQHKIDPNEEIQVTLTFGRENGDTHRFSQPPKSPSSCANISKLLRDAPKLNNRRLSTPTPRLDEQYSPVISPLVDPLSPSGYSTNNKMAVKTPFLPNLSRSPFQKNRPPLKEPLTQESDASRSSSDPPVSSPSPLVRASTCPLIKESDAAPPPHPFVRSYTRI